MKRTALLLLTLLLVFVIYTLYSTGFFRTIEPVMNNAVVASIPLPGVEDIEVDEDDNFAVFISFTRDDWENRATAKGSLYFMDLSDDTYTPKSILTDFDRPFLPHGISLYQLDSNHHRLFVINHGGGEFIEMFDLYNRDSLVHLRSLSNPLIYSPNDLVTIDGERFYFTNDTYFSSALGELAENYLGLSYCETVYFDGKDYRVVGEKQAYANGINYDAERQLLYVASVRDFNINVYDVAENGDLSFIEKVDCKSGVDNIELDREGRIYIGCHPDLIRAKNFIKGKSTSSASEIVRVDYRSKGDYEVETIYLNKGDEIGASTVAVPYKDQLFVGTVCDDHFIVLNAAAQK